MNRISATVVFIGDIDAGKSTTLGHLLCYCEANHAINRNIVAVAERESAEMGRGKFKYAWMLDTLLAERQRGVTITSLLKLIRRRINYQDTKIGKRYSVDHILQEISMTRCVNNSEGKLRSL
jgi:translation elongation factor EF-1alpha